VDLAEANRPSSACYVRSARGLPEAAPWSCTGSPSVCMSRFGQSKIADENTRSSCCSSSNPTSPRA
jgi:hypothetical protein